MNSSLIVIAYLLFPLVVLSQTKVEPSTELNNPIHFHNGKAMIGSGIPSEMLHVKGNVLINGISDNSLNVLGNLGAFLRIRVVNSSNSHNAGAGSLFYNNENKYAQLLFGSAFNSESASQFLIRSNGSGGMRFDLQGSGGDFIYTRSNGNELMRIKSSGKIGIGTISPEYMLDVAGTIRSKEIKVEAQTADFVFESDYNLRSLDEVESYILENKHLPDIPSAKEMDVDGVNLAEMNKLLLMKVEELTLYLIELQKVVKDQGVKLNNL